MLNLVPSGSPMIKATVQLRTVAFFLLSHGVEASRTNFIVRNYPTFWLIFFCFRNFLNFYALYSLKCITFAALFFK